MILAIRCDQPSFKTVTFTPGFNVVLAERTTESSTKDSRNGLGKSTLIEIIQFCLGASIGKSPLKAGQLKDWTFTLDLLLSGSKFSVSRNTGEPRTVIIRGGFQDWPILPIEVEDGAEMPVVQWNKLLGALMFGLAVDEQQKYAPTFRSLISYFVRRGRDAYSNPFEHHRRQQTWDKQVNNALLLGLDWESASERQALRERRKHLNTIRRAVKAGEFEGFSGSLAELRAERVRMAQEIAAITDELRRFRVHQQYEQIEARANRITANIHEMNNENIADRRLLDYYQNDMEVEESPSAEDISDLYEEVGILLPDMVMRRIGEANVFHRQIVENRHAFLNAERSRIQRSIEARSEQIRELSDERAALLAILETHGALSEYTKLQSQLGGEEARLRQLDNRIANLRKFEEERSDLKIREEELLQRSVLGFDERKEQWQPAIELFNRNSQVLYNAPGNLLIDVKETGFDFEVDIKRAESQGISNMKVFCYDLMLAQLWADHDPSPGFLVHDSTIFDGVDERQVATALQMAATAAEEPNVQYICTLNSDQVPTDDFPPDFSIDPYVRLTLTDATEDGGLLGIRY